MGRPFFAFTNRLVSKLILVVGITLLCSMSIWAFFNIRYQKEKLMKDIVAQADKLSNTIRLGAHYAMMLNSRDDINQIITNIARQEDIVNIRIYNKEGQIKFSNEPLDVERTTNIKAEACYICHRSSPPLSEVGQMERTRIFHSPQGHRLLGIISPICNEPACSSGSCHVHPEGKKVLGALDLVISLQNADRQLLQAERGIIQLSVFVFLVTSVIIFVFVLKFVNRPVNQLIRRTRMIARGEYSECTEVSQSGEMGQLASAIVQMGKEIGEKQTELNKQRNEYQNLFELVPCIITVQDRSYRLLRYNREFSEKFAPKPGDFCFSAYKGRRQKCVACPVERTFLDGKPHYSEESGVNKEGNPTHWIVNTSPIRDEKGEVVAAMEMCLDITSRKLLEEELQKSEKKYYAIFNNIPNPVFVLDMETLAILDCNQSVPAMYGFSKEEMINRSFLELFEEGERAGYAARIWPSTIFNQVKHVDKAGKTLFVNIRVSPSEYAGQKVLLVTTSDITKRLEAEQQLIQAGKMATLGEMATGVAHELNQPLSVIKTASSFLMRKVTKKEPIDPEILLTMAGEIDGHVDRASRIINHMRQFGRKSEITLGPVRINDAIRRSFEIFSQQLRVRGIEVVWELQEDLPLILGDPARLEQVFINLLINSRDAIEERQETRPQEILEKRIRINTRIEDRRVMVEVWDTGVGIPEAVIDRIFEPFFTTKKVGKGTGLGLSISYGIIQDCGGTIHVLSPAGGGTGFIMKFPIPDGNDEERNPAG